MIIPDVQAGARIDAVQAQVFIHHQSISHVIVTAKGEIVVERQRNQSVV